MPRQKAKYVGDTSVKYQVKRIDDSVESSRKGRSAIIRTNLEYDEAIALIKGFNKKEESSQLGREEKAQQDKVI
jgi:hypothetical protein